MRSRQGFIWNILNLKFCLKKQKQIFLFLISTNFQSRTPDIPWNNPWSISSDGENSSTVFRKWRPSWQEWPSPLHFPLPATWLSAPPPLLPLRASAQAILSAWHDLSPTFPLVSLENSAQSALSQGLWTFPTSLALFAILEDHVLHGTAYHYSKFTLMFMFLRLNLSSTLSRKFYKDSGNICPPLIVDPSTYDGPLHEYMNRRQENEWTRYILHAKA